MELGEQGKVVLRRKPSTEQYADRGGKSIKSHKHLELISYELCYVVDHKIGSHGKYIELNRVLNSRFLKQYLRRNMSESGIYFESSESDSEESDFSDEEADYDEYSLGEYYDEEEELYNEYEDSEEDRVREYNEEYSDEEPEIVTSDGGLTSGERRTGGRSGGIRSRVWDLSVLLGAFSLAIVFGYYSL